MKAVVARLQLMEFSAYFFKIQSGVRQGCVLSPLLFGIAIDWVLKTSMVEMADISWAEAYASSDLDFADDTALLHDSWDEMQTIMSSLENETRKVGLVINVADENHVDRQLGVIGKDSCRYLEECDEFCYLHSTINNEDGCDREIMIRLGKANSTFGRLGRIWASNSISIRIKVRLYEALIFTVLLYGAETRLMKRATTKKLEATHKRWLRKIMRISWEDKVRNEKVRELSQ